jgi:hypothetical protein
VIAQQVVLRLVVHLEVVADEVDKPFGSAGIQVASLHVVEQVKKSALGQLVGFGLIG